MSNQKNKRAKNPCYNIQVKELKQKVENQRFQIHAVETKLEVEREAAASKEFSLIVKYTAREEELKKALAWTAGLMLIIGIGIGMLL